MNKVALREEDNVQDGWYEEAKDMTLEQLPEFMRHLAEDYQHDYGTICHALAASAIASCWAMNKSESGGITGFQVGAVMWEFIRHWNYSHNKTGLRLIDYDNFLYPQYEDDFDKMISKDVWENLVKEARNYIAKANKDHAEYLIKREQYEKDLAAFIEKYPDYPERKDYYERLGMGTGEEWEAEKRKEESGFEFAPSKPWEPVNRESPVYEHWERIVAGIVPFGYRVE